MHPFKCLAIGGGGLLRHPLLSNSAVTLHRTAHLSVLIEVVGNTCRAQGPQSILASRAQHGKESSSWKPLRAPHSILYFPETSD